MSKELFIHLGLPKTGTTTLQNRIFQNHDEYLYLGKFNEGTNYSYGEYTEEEWLLSFKRSLIAKDIPFFKTFDFEKVLLERFGTEYQNANKLFLSEESILGRCIGPGKYGSMVRIGSAYEVFTKLKILSENTPSLSIKVILVLRKQDDLLESFFAEEYHNFKSFLGMKKPEDLIQYLFENAQMEETDSLFRYASLIGHIDKLFGKENALVLPYEKLKSDAEEFLKDLTTFMQISPWKDVDLIKEKKDNSRDLQNTKGKVAKRKPFRKKLAQIKTRLIGEIPTGLGDKMRFIDNFQKDTIVKLDELYKEKILTHYAEENRELEHRVTNISAYNYF